MFPPLSPHAHASPSSRPSVHRLGDRRPGAERGRATRGPDHRSAAGRCGRHAVAPRPAWRPQPRDRGTGPADPAAPAPGGPRGAFRPAAPSSGRDRGEGFRVAVPCAARLPRARWAGRPGVADAGGHKACRTARAKRGRGAGCDEFGLGRARSVDGRPIRVRRGVGRHVAGRSGVRCGGSAGQVDPDGGWTRPVCVGGRQPGRRRSSADRPSVRDEPVASAASGPWEAPDQAA